MKRNVKHIIYFLVALALLLLLSSLFHFRIDLTSDKRHSLSPVSKSLMKQVEEPIEATLYLNGDLNPGFTRLRNNTVSLLEELRAQGRSKISIVQINPAEAKSTEEQEQQFAELEARGMPPVAVYEKDKEGKLMQKPVFPWLELSSKGKTTSVNLLKNIPNLSGEENLNISIENLEYEVSEAIRRLNKKGIDKVAFLEGQGELNEWETYDISHSLSRYFQIDRGEIGADAHVLDEYKAVVIAKPTEPFSEAVKFVLDQYLMRGGKLLWLVDAVRISEEQLSTNGLSPAMPLELNLDDMFFRYGVRLMPALIQDVQSLLMPVDVAGESDPAHFEAMPFVYSPLLLTFPGHPISKNIAPVLSEFTSPIELVGENKGVKSTLLLASSERSRLVQTPAQVALNEIPDLRSRELFNLSHIPVAVVLEGEFQSVFANRMPPPEIENAEAVIHKSKASKQIIIADGDIIRNRLSPGEEIPEALPLGLDRYSGQVFGNSEFLVNALLYLTDESGRLELRSRTLPLRLLNKSAVTDNKLKLQIINIVIPLILLFLFGALYNWNRKRKFTN